MENNPKKSKAFIITFILILILLIAGYYLYKNRTQMFGAKGTTSVSKIFSPLLGTSKNKDLKVIENPVPTPATTTVPKKTGVVITDANGNKMVLSEAGEILKKGDVLYIAGFNKNDQPIVMKAIANDKNKSLVFGVAGEDMNKGALGNVIIEGILTGIPTNRKEGTLWVAKNTLYLSDKIYGGMTKNSPVAPSYIVPVGSVIKVDSKNGSIRIGGLNDTLTTNLEKLNLLLLSNSNMQLMNAVVDDLRNYWSSVFGNGLFGNIDYTGVGNITPGMPPLNPINIPTGNSIGNGNSGTGNNNGGNGNGNGNSGTGNNNGGNGNGNGNSGTGNNNGGNGNGNNNGGNTGGTDYTATSGNTECSDKIDNDGDGLIDEADPNCHIGGDLAKAYVPLHNSESTSPVDPKTTDIVNKCLLIDQNPLTFNDEEQAKLAELLRKFYLLAPKIKTEDSITSTYSEMDQYTSFISQIESLTNQCYNETGTPNYKGPRLVGGNPYYKYNERTTYLTDEQATPFCYGIIKKGPNQGQSCSGFETADDCIVGGNYVVTKSKLKWWNVVLPITSVINKPFTSTTDTGVGMYEVRSDFLTGCQWLNPREYEQILNVW